MSSAIFHIGSSPSSPTERLPPSYASPIHGSGFDTPKDERRVIEAYHGTQSLPGTRWMHLKGNGNEVNKKGSNGLRVNVAQGWFGRKTFGKLHVAIIALIVVWFLYLRMDSIDGEAGYMGNGIPGFRIHKNDENGLVVTTTSHDLVSFPVQRPPPSPGSSHYKSQRYLSFLPHSGFHNQRLALENALTLAALLDRTLLLPPVWLGLAIPYIAYDKLVKRIQAVDKAGLDHCREWSPQNGTQGTALPRECLDYFDFTTLSWDTLIDMSKVLDKINVVDRMDFSDKWLTDSLGIDLVKDVHWLKDATTYQYRIYSDPNDDDELGKFESRLDISRLRQPDISAKRLLAIGSTFGTTRLRLVDSDSADVRRHFRECMVFRQPLLEVASNAIKDRLGGEAGYYGLHIRLGDGVFRENAKQNVDDTLEQLVVNKMKLSRQILDRVKDLHRERQAQLSRKSRYGFGRWSNPKLKPRSASVSESTHQEAAREPRVKRENSQPQKDGAYNHKPLPRLPIIRSAKDLQLGKGMKCRGRFWKDDSMLPFNAPLFIATDSVRPASDPLLSIFFSTFPCTFVLGDFFSDVKALHDLSQLRNAVDQVGLGGFFIPFVDAMVASKGRAIVGTSGSTFSRFAVDVLHQTYHGWPILERG